MNNPIIRSDFPDPDVIRVGDTYYMVTTTMHFFPGCEILRSYDLLHWEHCSYVTDVLDNTIGQRLDDGKGIYGKGMWAASIRYHKGLFYITFVANDTGKTYLFTSETIDGVWQKHYIDGFFHDCSLLFDDDGRVFIVSGNTEIHLTELNDDLTAPKDGGIDKIIVSDRAGRDDGTVMLGYEGAHIYKINGRYYIFFIHWYSKDSQKKPIRTESCFVSDSIDGEYIGGDVLSDDMDFFNNGAAQGGVVDTPDGRWFAMLFRDNGALGRIPVLVTVKFTDDGLPLFGVNGKVPHDIETGLAPVSVKPLKCGDSFEGLISENAQWNHIPDLSLVSFSDKPSMIIRTDRTVNDLCLAKNILTYRTFGDKDCAEVTVDASRLNDGDIAGISAFQGCYGFAGITKADGRYYAVMQCRRRGDDTAVEYESVPLSGSTITLRAEFDFTDLRDEVRFCIKSDDIAGKTRQIGIVHKLYFMLDHFTGCRIGLFVMSTKQSGGSAEFTNLIH